MIHEQAIPRITASQASGPHLVELFQQMAAEAEKLGEDNMTVSVSFIEKGDDFKVDSFVPEIVLAVRRVCNDP